MQAVIEFARWLGATPLSIAIQSSTWLTPLLQAVHIVMVGIVFVSMLMIALRVFNHTRVDEAFEAVWNRFAPWMWRAVCVMAASGIVLIIGEPVRQTQALSFWLKMGLIGINLLLILALRRRATPAGGRGIAVAVMGIWIAIIFLGRAIAYDTEVWGAWSLGA
jgi:uncharacterized membrane protein SirB2